MLNINYNSDIVRKCQGQRIEANNLIMQIQITLSFH